MASPYEEIEAGDRIVKVTNPDRVYFPETGQTKLDMVQYYLAVGEGIVRALRERPCMMRRFPTGVTGEDVYQKRVPDHRPPWVESARVTFPSGRHADELCVTEIGSVIWAAQMSCVEFHSWPSRRADTEAPDELRIDLDPQPGTSFDDARGVAGHVHELLAELGWEGWPKTSGNRGIHIYIRIEPRWPQVTVRRAALALAREVERRIPDLVTTKWWKEERGEKIFIDYNQNARDHTIASAYSVRAKPWAPVSTPFRWDELPDVQTRDFTISTVPGRVAELCDLHAGIDDVAVALDPLLEWAERDEVDRGLADAPYPPNHPKMPGEPMRVQPSRAKKRPSTT